MTGSFYEIKISGRSINIYYSNWHLLPVLNPWFSVSLSNMFSQKDFE